MTQGVGIHNTQIAPELCWYSWATWIPMDRGAQWATVHGIAKSQTQLSDWHFHFRKQPKGWHHPGFNFLSNMAKLIFRILINCCSWMGPLLSLNCWLPPGLWGCAHHLFKPLNLNSASGRFNQSSWRVDDNKERKENMVPNATAEQKVLRGALINYQKHWPDSRAKFHLTCLQGGRFPSRSNSGFTTLPESLFISQVLVNMLKLSTKWSNSELPLLQVSVPPPQMWWAKEFLYSFHRLSFFFADLSPSPNYRSSESGWLIMDLPNLEAFTKVNLWNDLMQIRPCSAPSRALCSI